MIVQHERDSLHAENNIKNQQPRNFTDDRPKRIDEAEAMHIQALFTRSFLLTLPDHFDEILRQHLGAGDVIKILAAILRLDN